MEDRPMHEHCIAAEQIGELAALAPDHPLRVHAGACPRCRSLLLEYHAFVAADPSPEAALDDARDPLDAAIYEGARRLAPAGIRRLRRARMPWWRGLPRPAQLVAAAMLVVVAAVVWMNRNPDAPVLRSGGGPGANAFSIQPAIVTADGAIHFSWDAVDGADGYELLLYGPDLSEVYRHPAVTACSVVVDRAELGDRVATDAELTWRVRALTGGDLLQISTPGSVRLR
ncbi:MAG TPA: hypothetical protein VFX92_00485 [Candidatus Krumholzibacteria bacterium]|nr:hypothetical protein [Candidatus Krumholzibacteria bacterium]